MGVRDRGGGGGGGVARGEGIKKVHKNRCPEKFR